MTRHNPLVSIKHMLDHAREAIAIAEGLTRSDLDNNRIKVLALTRLLEIIGEAAARVPEQTRIDYPYIPWREIVGNRNRLIHGYDNVDLDILWTIISEDLLHLVSELESE